MYISAFEMLIYKWFLLILPWRQRGGDGLVEGVSDEESWVGMISELVWVQALVGEVFLFFQFFYFCNLVSMYNSFIKFSKCKYAFFTKNKFWKNKKTSPTEARTHTNSEIITDPFTKPSPPRCLHENSRQKLDKHFKLLVKYYNSIPIYQ